MEQIGRRTVLGTGLGLAGAALAMPHIARAAATTINIWWNEGFYPAEDAAFHRLVRDWEKASGNKAQVLMLPVGPLNTRIIAAITSGAVPDVWYSDTGASQIVPQNAWHGKLVDVSDVVETQKSEYLPTALTASRFYNAVEKRRSYYGVPYKTAVLILHVWRSLVEKAGYKLSDMPQQWDQLCMWFWPMQDKLRHSMRRIYANGFQLDTSDGSADPNNTFEAFLIAHGGVGIVDPHGRLQANDPAVRKAAVDSVAFLTNAYKKGYVPPGSLDWNDASDNNAYHAQEIMMDFDATISTEVAEIDNKQWYYHDMAAFPLPNDVNGKPTPPVLGAEIACISQGAKNVKPAKEFLTYLIQPKVVDAYLVEALGRWTPVMPKVMHSNPFWLDPKNPPVRVQTSSVLGPTVPPFYSYNPAWAVVLAQHIWPGAADDVLLHNMTPEQAVANAFNRVKAVFDQYQIPQSTASK
ncbi:MAG TPA: ABC transporter substrate-binding protein [Acetobacteraceae bacterium]|nr:ABC transporter substrate-binding protein [Acetobacteraceae bacterium]